MHSWEACCNDVVGMLLHEDQQQGEGAHEGKHAWDSCRTYHTCGHTKSSKHMPARVPSQRLTCPSL